MDGSYVQLFWESVDRRFARDILRFLFDGYRLADEYCSTTFEKPEASNARPFIRRGFIEQQFRAIAKRHSMKAESVRGNGNFWFHTLITSGRVMLTQCTVKDPEEVVRPSFDRMQYAHRNEQKYLFPEMQPDDPPPDLPLYGILIHGRSLESSALPGFAHVVFPLPDLTGYYNARIDLFKEFVDIVRLMSPKTGIGRDEDGGAEPELREDQDIG